MQNNNSVSMIEEGLIILTKVIQNYKIYRLLNENYFKCPQLLFLFFTFIIPRCR